jgi:23S rRNA (cytidine1920-2'-O)/16S rRNA (cytidine1409-2'-O)-methyltransferase
VFFVVKKKFFKMSQKIRLDNLITQKGLAESRQKAQGMIMAGIVRVDGRKVDKSGTLISLEAEVTVKGKTCPYVSRGGIKLQGALDEFQIQVEGSVALDIGASTGGFTDCLLQYGATRVYAVDVGYGQIDWKLRCDKRVVVCDRTNARYLSTDNFEEMIDLIVIDVSFISLTKILPATVGILTDEGEILALVKPQFEVGRSEVGKKGVVRDPQKHKSAIESVINAAEGLGYSCCGIARSPITGPKGNVEFFVRLNRKEEREYQTLVDSLFSSNSQKR